MHVSLSFMISRVLIGIWLLSVRLTFLLCWSPSISILPRTPTPACRSDSGNSIRSSSMTMSSHHFDTDNNITNAASEIQPPPPPPPSNNNNNTVKRLLCVRHGVSVANEWMSRPGNQWGDANFRDSGQPDAPLSETGRQHMQEFLRLQFQRQKSNELLLQVALDQVELVIVSPLTRCLETYHYGIEPMLLERSRMRHKKKNIPILALPLLRERVYTTSDTGRPVSQLKLEFPNVDFSECPSDDCPWWYVGANVDDNDDWAEWRPHGENQWYAVRGEPEAVFQERMKSLDDWIGHRTEKTILVVSHWGVIRHLTNGVEFLNAEAKIIEHTFCPITTERTSSIMVN